MKIIIVNRAGTQHFRFPQLVCRPCCRTGAQHTLKKLISLFLPHCLARAQFYYSHIYLKYLSYTHVPSKINNDNNDNSNNN